MSIWLYIYAVSVPAHPAGVQPFLFENRGCYPRLLSVSPAGLSRLMRLRYFLNCSSFHVMEWGGGIESANTSYFDGEDDWRMGAPVFTEAGQVERIAQRVQEFFSH